MASKETTKTYTQLSSSISTGGGGIHFENRVQASFAILMLVDGCSPCLYSWPITKIKMQGKYQGFDTDDLIIYAVNPYTKEQNKLLGQIKYKIAIRESNNDFCEVIKAAWHDFNSANFHKGDAIALICGPLSETDTNAGRALLEQARYSESALDFIQRIEIANFTSEKQRTKFKILKAVLKKANDDIDLTDEELWAFLKSFHILIYDLDIKGVILALMHTIITQFSNNNAPALWAQMQEYVAYVSEHAGCITKDTILDNISLQFKSPISKTIPKEFVENDSELTSNWNNHSYSNEILLATLLGEWDEKYPADKEIISQFVGEDYEEWIAKLREVLQYEESIFTFADGIWKVKDRKLLLEALHTRVFDDILESLKRIILKVLSERDPQFELPKKERHIAGVHGKALKYSSYLRKGLAEGLTLIGCFSELFINCTNNKNKYFSILTIREIFDDVDWILWGSLNDIISFVAEASPDEFLSVCESTLQKSPCPFEILFKQEETGVFGRNYLTGLLWALESLAWKEDNLVRVTLVLGELAQIDPGGNWANRPINSISTIFLPWHPQTIASIEKRKVAIQTLINEAPDIAWNVLLNLLPGWNQTTFGSNRPVWRSYIPEDWTEGVTVGEYRNQIQIYADFAVEFSKGDISYLIDLVEYLNKVSKESFDNIVDNISSDTIIALPENIRLKLWNELIKFINKNERHSEADWALDSSSLLQLKDAAQKIEPENPINLFYPLFNEYDHILYDNDEEWHIQIEHLNERRQQAIETIIGFGGIDAIIELTRNVERPDVIGRFLGKVVRKNFDEIILPRLLTDENNKMTIFACAYVGSKKESLGWEWVDSYNFSEWTAGQIALFFTALPFNHYTWQRVNHRLHDREIEYWKKAFVIPRSIENLDHAIDKLIKYDRPYAAIDCLNMQLHENKPINKDKAIAALFGAITSKEDIKTMDSYHIIKLIGALQEDENIAEETIIGIEWSYLPLILSNDYKDIRPKFLERKMSTEPQFFCDVIRKCYRSKNDYKKQHSNEDFNQAVATNAWKLLQSWGIPPGMQDDGNFCGNKFNEWLEKTKEICTKSGHIQVALVYIGHVLYYCPPDSSGFWINKTVAQILNKKDSEPIRNGLYTQVKNSRGMHWIDPSGEPEKKLAEKYRRRAEETENSGYLRLALTFRKLAESYEREALSVINEHKQEES